MNDWTRDTPLKVGLHAPEQCARGRADCRSLAQVISTQKPYTFICCGEVKPGCSPVPQDQWSFCMGCDEDGNRPIGTNLRVFIDRVDMADMASVLATGLSMTVDRWAANKEREAGVADCAGNPSSPALSPSPGTQTVPGGDLGAASPLHVALPVANDAPHSSTEDGVGACKTSPELLALLEKAGAHRMTPDEVYEQRRSFARGMCPSNRDYTEWCRLVDEMLPPRPAATWEKSHRAALERIKELEGALGGILAITNRNHVAWDAARAALGRARGEQDGMRNPL